MRCSTEPNIPTAVPIDSAQAQPNSDIPVAARFIDWDEISERLVGHLDNAIWFMCFMSDLAAIEDARARRQEGQARSEDRKARAAESAADHEEFKANLIKAFGAMFGINIGTKGREREADRKRDRADVHRERADEHRDAADEHRENAAQIRIAGLKWGMAYLLAATSVEVMRWSYQQGLLHTAFYSAKNTLNSAKNKVITWIYGSNSDQPGVNIVNDKRPSAPPAPSASVVSLDPGSDLDGKQLPAPSAPPADQVFAATDKPGYVPGTGRTSPMPTPL